MSQVPLLSGVVGTERAEFVLSYPVNLEPVTIESGISKGQLRSAMGAASLGSGPGIDRGAVVWNGILHRVMGTKLVSVTTSGTVTVLGDVGGTGPVSLARFDAYLAIRSGTSLYYWNGATLTQVTDPDLGASIDISRLNGQLFSTDGKYIIAAQLADPTQIDPNKYGAAESDPDGIVGLIEVRNELYACGQNTIDVLSYVGGAGFPLQLDQGATIPIGVCGTKAKIRFSQSFAFVGAAEGEALGVYLAGSGTATKLSTRRIDDYLAKELNQEAIQLEKRVFGDEERLYVHLTDKTLVFLKRATEQAQQPVWYVVSSGRGMDKSYRPRNATLFNGKWIVGDIESSALGVLDESIADHFGEPVGWLFDTILLYNKAKGGIVQTLELVGLPGRASGQSSIFLSFTLDGETWSIERANRTPAKGQRQKRTAWMPHKRFANYMGMRFRGDSGSLVGIAALEAETDPLSV